MPVAPAAATTNVMYQAAQAQYDAQLAQYEAHLVAAGYNPEDARRASSSASANYAAQLAQSSTAATHQQRPGGPHF